MKTFFEIYHFCGEKLPCVKNWSFSRFKDWLQFKQKSSHAVISEKDGKLNGVLVLRPIADIAQSEDRYAHDNNGDILYVETALFLDKNAREHCINAMRQRVGERKQIAFKRNDKIKVYSCEKLLKLLEK